MISAIIVLIRNSFNVYVFILLICMCIYTCSCETYIMCFLSVLTGPLGRAVLDTERATLVK